MSGSANMRRSLGLAVVALLSTRSAALGAAPAACPPKLKVATKPFTESYVLSEIVGLIIDDSKESAAEPYGLAGPTLVFDALESGVVDLDVNYTGSIANLLLKDVENGKKADLPAIRAALAPRAIVLSDPLGFNNTYAIAVRRETAPSLNLHKVSDLRAHSDLRGAFTPDFLNFDDGFYRLQEVYGVRLSSVRPMQHSLAYRALANGEIDVTDAYTTDGSLAEFQLTLLEDDREFFPKYYGVIAARREVTERCPRTWAALRRLEGRISDARMTELNARVESKKASVLETARSFLLEERLIESAEQHSQIDRGLWVNTWQHLGLVLVSLLLSCLVGVPLGIVAFRDRRLGHLVIGAAGLLQTIPSLALLCFLIPLLGIGALPTVCALFIYGLLPIVQSTTSGLLSLDPQLIETARILGLTRGQRLRLIELPLASINIMAGIKTTAVINVATATIAALIGAGGYGQYITSGLAMNDNATILKGAIPTALMALAFHGTFELLNRMMVPEGLRDPRS